MTPFDTNWKEGSGATPLTIQDLRKVDAISIPTAPTNIHHFTAFSDAAINDILVLRDKKKAEGLKVPNAVVIDARRKPSASKR